jgi:hypothetical protein
MIALIRYALVLPGLIVFTASAQTDSSAPRLWNDSVETRLALAGTNRAEIIRAFNEAATDRREGLSFLVENMPEVDLKTLSAPFLLEHLNLAYEAWGKSPWREQVSKELFLNDVLPYVSLNEEREAWRAKLRSECLPMIEGVKSPGEAAHRLNQKIFKHFKVTYNTSRNRPDQGPGESIASGKATCTGLSILLVDACRAVGIPARIAGTAMWINMRGNHTWVEVWDNGWKFCGAAEPDPAGLNRGWFVRDAAKAQRDVPHHAIWATSFKRTPDHFPLVWLPGDTSVPAVNVTERYVARAAPAREEDAVLSVKVMDAAGRRVVAELTVIDLELPDKTLTGKSRGESADLNDFTNFKVNSKRRYRVAASLDGRTQTTDVKMSSPDQLMTMVLPEKPSATAEVISLIDKGLK